MSQSEAAAELLSVRDLHVEFAGRAGVVEAVRGISFDLRAGETLAVLGESGCGKSATAQALIGLLPRPSGRISAGQVVFEGVDLVASQDSYVRRLRGTRIAMVFQDPLSSLNPVLRVGYQIAEMFRRHRGASRKAARVAALELMGRVGIPDPRRRADDYPHQFSGGMRQRVMIAIALALDPSLLIADEPTTALDVTVQAQIMELLGELQAELGMALILITHDLGVVADIADEVAIMYAGKIVERGSLHEVYDHAAHPYTVGMMSSAPRLDRTDDRLVPITGSPPDLLTLPAGCSFRPRCTFATELCAVEGPPLAEVRGRPGTHGSACHHAEEVWRRAGQRV